MYLDIVVLSGIGVVGLMIAFFGGVYYFLRKDAQQNKKK
ncbi:cytochrome c oxidase subunit CcoM [Reinekea sp.]|jgi:cbb3-type cytochrome oxidase subunit 3